MRTGTVRTAGCARSSSRMRRSEDAGGAATADGASARAGAAMNDEGRGFSLDSHEAAGAPLDRTRGRARRPRFFSASGFAALGTAGTLGATGEGAAGEGLTAFSLGAAFSGLAAGLTAALTGGFAGDFAA